MLPPFREIAYRKRRRRLRRDYGYSALACSIDFSARPPPDRRKSAEISARDKKPSVFRVPPSSVSCLCVRIERRDAREGEGGGSHFTVGFPRFARTENSIIGRRRSRLDDELILPERRHFSPSKSRDESLFQPKTTLPTCATLATTPSDEDDEGKTRRRRETAPNRAISRKYEKTARGRRREKYARNSRRNGFISAGNGLDLYRGCFQMNGSDTLNAPRQPMNSKARLASPHPLLPICWLAPPASHPRSEVVRPKRIERNRERE